MNSTRVSIIDLPDEILLPIFSYDILDRRNLYSLALMSRRFDSLAAIRLYNIIECLSHRL